MSELKELKREVAKRFLHGMLLVVFGIILAVFKPVSVNAEVQAGSSAIDFVFEHRYYTTVNTIVHNYKVYGYSNCYLSGDAVAYIASGKSIPATILDVYRNGIKSSVKLCDKAGNTYWFPIQAVLDSTSFQIYNYQATKSFVCYKNSLGQSAGYRYNVSASKTGTSRNDVTIIGSSGQYVQAYAGFRIFWIRKADLFSKPFESKSCYTIQPEEKNGIYYWYVTTNGSTRNGENIVLKRQFFKNNRAKHAYVLQYNSATGFYKIQGLNSGLYFDVRNGSTASGTALQQYIGNSTFAQEFQIFGSAQTGYYIRSKLGTYISLPSGLKNNSPLKLLTGAGRIHQRWSFARY